MLNTLFAGIFDSGTTASISVGDFLLCIFVSLLIGLFLAFVYAFKSRYTQSFVITLALLPAIVCVVIMMVNGMGYLGYAILFTFVLGMCMLIYNLIGMGKTTKPCLNKTLRITIP